jgi:hypothetical protein
MSAAEPRGALTRDELDALARPPVEQLAAVVASGDVDASVATFLRLEGAYREFITGFHAFTAAIREHVLGRGGPAALAALDAAALRGALVDAARHGADAAMLDATRGPDGSAERFRERLEAAGAVGAMEVFDEVENALRRLHDVAVGQVAAALSHVYRTDGVDELEACLRHCGDRTLLAWMPRERTRPLDRRVRQWASMMLANFATIRVDRTDDGFVITQDPCGTCSRQVLAGAYEGPDAYAVVEEPHAVTWQRGGVPVYRTHVAVMHDLMPRERTGAPWPEITCPAGAGAGPCRIVLRSAE